MLRCMRETITAKYLIDEIIRNNEFILPRELLSGECENILSSLAVEAFADSNPENDHLRSKPRSGVPLGQLAINLVIHYTELDENGLSPGIKCIEANPILGAYALIEEMFLNLKREAVRIDTTNGGDWPKLMKTLALPLDDTIFVKRQAHIVAQTSFVVGKKLIERLKFFTTPTGSAMLR
jgi:hypothetical protein